MFNPLVLSLVTALMYVLSLHWLAQGYAFFPFLLLAQGLISLATLLCYGLDKRAAIHQRSRTPEKTLHLLALSGGWPGALIARPLFRHKTRKQPFTAIFWCSVLLSAGALIAFLLLAQMAPARDWLHLEAQQWRLFVQQYLSG